MIFDYLKQAAVARYGSAPKWSNKAAEMEIDEILAADTSEKIQAFLEKKGAEATGGEAESYLWWVEHNTFTPTTWRRVDVDSSVKRLGQEDAEVTHVQPELDLSSKQRINER